MLNTDIIESTTYQPLEWCVIMVYLSIDSIDLKTEYLRAGKQSYCSHTTKKKMNLNLFYVNSVIQKKLKPGYFWIDVSGAYPKQYST